MKGKIRTALTALSMGLLAACATVPQRPAQVPPEIEFAELSGTRIGLLVMTADGRELMSHRADERFVPASNTKLFTIAAALHAWDDPGLPDVEGAAFVRIEAGTGEELPDIALVGGGDATLSDRTDCAQNCLEFLADAVAAEGLSAAGRIIADESRLQGARWPEGWSWNNLQWYYGTAVSALTVNENELALEVVPGSLPGEPVTAKWADRDDLMVLDNRAVTGEATADDSLSLRRYPGEPALLLSGTMPVGAAPRLLYLGLDDPAWFAAERLRRHLEARGVETSGVVTVRRHGDPQPEGVEIARLDAPPLIDSLRRIGIDSQNLTAELIQRRLAAAEPGTPPEAEPDALAALLADIGIAPGTAEFSDASGLSVHNRITPRSAVRLLLWADGQPWREAWRSTFPAGGVSGTLARRFKGTPLEGRILAKTGTLRGVNALSGYMTAASGQTLVFSVLVNDRPADAPSLIPAVDTMLLRIAAEY